MNTRTVRSKPTFLSGIASLWDFPGNLRYRRASDPDAEARALEHVWESVGLSIWEAMREFEEETDIRVLDEYLASHSPLSDDPRTTA